MKYLLCYIALASLVCFTAMGVDKARAKRHKWRISEKTLVVLAALGGALGGCLAMALFRHKTQHKLFQVSFPLLLVIQAALVFLLWKLGVLT